MNKAAFGASFFSAFVIVAIAGGQPSALAGPTTDAGGYVDSTARCAAPNTAVVFGSTATSRVAICTDASGQYQYRGVRLSDGARLILDAKSTDGGFVAENDGITYTVTSKSLVVKTGSQVSRTEPMVDFHGQTPAASPPTQPSAAPDTPTPTAPLPPPLPAEAGG